MKEIRLVLMEALVLQKKSLVLILVNFYIVYYLDAWSKITFRGLTLKNCLLGATNIVKNRDKERYV